MHTRTPAKLFSIFLAALLAGTVVHLQTAQADASEAVVRSAGPERISTAVAASRDHRAAASHALIANAHNFPDALSATALAASLDAPLLLTRQDALPDEVVEELTRLGVSTVWLLGGTSAISAGVEEALRGLGYEVQRIGGENRYATARDVALEAGPADTGEVVVALGNHPDPERAWPDAVASGALAASPDRLPTLLTAHNHLPDATAEALSLLDPERVLLIGGESAIEANVEDEIRRLGLTVRRIAGTSRYDTSIALAQDALNRANGTEQTVVFATGGDFPDALAAGALAGSLEGPLVLVPTQRLASTVAAFLREHTARWDGGVVVGGQVAASDFVLDELTAAINDQPAPEPPVEEEPEPDEPRVLQTFEGEASYYGARFHGRRTASGEVFDMYALTAAHPSLPFGTIVRVTHLGNGRQVTVRINDRGPFVGGRVIDLSYAAAQEIGMISSGIAQVRGEVLGD